MIHAVLTCGGSRGAPATADLSTYLTAELKEIVRADTDAWIKRLRDVSYDGRSMREQFTYRQDSLWWFTELYLAKRRRLEAAVATILALEAARDAYGHTAMSLETDDLVVRDAAHTFGRTRQLPIETRGRQIERQRHARATYLTGLTATLSRSRPSAPVFLPLATTVAVFVQTAFSGEPARRQGRSPSYIPQILNALVERVGAEKIRCVGVGSRRNLRRRRGLARIDGSADLPITPIEHLTPPGQLGGAIEVWRRRSALAQQITTGDSVRAAGRLRQYDLWAVLHRELESVALQQWPWAARAMDETAAALGAINPELVATCDEADGWGRALILEARRRNVPCVALPSERPAPLEFALCHEPDEMSARGPDRGVPIPDRVLVFDQRTVDRLDDAGHIPSSRIVVTGHPRDDGARVTRLTRMSEESRRDARRELGVADEQRLAVLVARSDELGDLLPAIVAAAVARPNVHLAIKAHPADAPELYLGLAGSAPNVRIVPDSFDLARLIASADGLITRESTVAVNALAVGVPSLVVGSPDHLGPLVDAGIMIGATAPAEIGQSVDTLLYDDQVRKRLKRVVGVDSARDERASARAADRAADAILELRPHT